MLWYPYLLLNQIPLTHHICWISSLSFCLFQTTDEIFFHPFGNLNSEVTFADYTYSICVSFISTTRGVSMDGCEPTCPSYTSRKHAAVSSSSIRQNSSKKNCQQSRRHFTTVFYFAFKFRTALYLQKINKNSSLFQLWPYVLSFVHLSYQ